MNTTGCFLVSQWTVASLVYDTAASLSCLCLPVWPIPLCASPYPRVQTGPRQGPCPFPRPSSLPPQTRASPCVLLRPWVGLIASSSCISGLDFSTRSTRTLSGRLSWNVSLLLMMSDTLCWYLVGHAQDFCLCVWSSGLACPSSLLPAASTSLLPCPVHLAHCDQHEMTFSLTDLGICILE